MRIYVGNLSRDVTEEDLRESFQSFGHIDEIKVIKDRFNGVSKGFAFVEMGIETEAKNAIAGLHGKELKGRSLDVNEAKPRTEHPSRSNWDGGRSGGGGRGGRKGGGGRRF